MYEGATHDTLKAGIIIQLDIFKLKIRANIDDRGENHHVTTILFPRFWRSTTNIALILNWLQ